MTVYKVVVGIWKHWKNGFESGHVETTTYYASLESVNKIREEIESNPYWCDYEHNRQPITERESWKAPTFKVEEIEVLD